MKREYIATKNPGRKGGNHATKNVGSGDGKSVAKRKVSDAAHPHVPVGQKTPTGYR